MDLAGHLGRRILCPQSMASYSLLTKDDKLFGSPTNIGFRLLTPKSPIIWVASPTFSLKGSNIATLYLRVTLL